MGRVSHRGWSWRAGGVDNIVALPVQSPAKDTVDAPLRCGFIGADYAKLRLSSRDICAAMDLNEFEAFVHDVMHSLPEWVHQALDNVEVLVLEDADEDLDPDGEGLLGLYAGMPLPERGIDYAGELPDVIYIFRRPHLDMGLSAAELRDEIAKTLIHEIAHYFGIEDDHLDDIGWG